MKKAGIREVKAHLSKYLQDVKKGDEVIITDHGRAVAHIVPVGSGGEGGRLYESPGSPTAYSGETYQLFRRKVTTHSDQSYQGVGAKRRWFDSFYVISGFKST